MLNRWLCIILGFSAITLGGGCDAKRPGRAVITGSVSYRGEPIQQGRITFFPQQGTNAPLAGTVIENGKYRVDSKGGAVVGNYIVKITAYRPRPTKSTGAPTDSRPGPPDADMPLQFLPEKYNRRTELTAAVPIDSAEVALDFTLN